MKNMYIVQWLSRRWEEKKNTKKNEQTIRLDQWPSC